MNLIVIYKIFFKIIFNLKKEVIFLLHQRFRVESSVHIYI